MTVLGKVASLKPIRNKDNGRSYRLAPNIIFGKAQKQPPVRQPNDASHRREYLMPDEVD
jgi:hypothetical protein